MRSAVRLVVVGSLVAAGALGFAACRGATQVMLDVRTNANCSDTANWKGVAVYIGEPGIDVETKAPVLSTSACGAGGEIGNLYVVPTGSNDGRVGIRVVAGITRKPEDCAGADYDGCIVARRTIDYLPHDSEDVIVDLTTDCVGNACDINHTCVNGSCTDTVEADPLVAEDGGVLVVPKLDASVATAADSAASAPDSAESSGKPTVRCGTGSLTCPANDLSVVCCVAGAAIFADAAAPTPPACVAPESCPFDKATLYCDDSADCSQDGADASDPFICCESIRTVGSGMPYTTSGAICTAVSQCDHGNGEALSLCDERQVCPFTGNACQSDDFAPGYYDCTAY